MAKVKLNSMIEWFSGSFDKLVIRRSHSGDQVVSRKPDMSKVKWSPAQVAHREKMSAAFAYARDAVRDPRLRDYYLKMARRKKNNRPFDMAVSDYCKGNILLAEHRPRDAREPGTYRK